MNKEHHTSDFLFVILALALLGAVIWTKYKIAFWRWYFDHRILVAVFLTAIIAGIYLKIREKFWNKREPKDLENEVLGKSDSDPYVYGGMTDAGKLVHFKLSSRRMHTQIVGTTNAGKTESVILPWIVDDIKNSRGLIIIDGKSDRSLLEKLYAYAKRYGRAEDVKILSICNTEISHSFNPMAGGSPLEVTERIFKALNFENEYYKSLQYEALLQILLIFEAVKLPPTPLRVIDALRSPTQLLALANKGQKMELIQWVNEFILLSAENREQRTSGLRTQLQPLCVGDTAQIFNLDNSDIDLEHALENNQIIYCQLPVLKIPTLGKATGKLILQSLQSAVASRHLGQSKNKSFFSVYLDDFTEYLTDSFVSLLNKSRSANVGVVFAHQALGDLAALGDGVKNTIMTNANLKIFMRTNEPESAEYFSKVIGTTDTEKVTERQVKSFMGPTKTGDGSVRETEAFKFHPNLFKQELRTGQGIAVIPHANGSLAVKVNFKMLFDLAPIPIPTVFKPMPVGLGSLDSKQTPSPQVSSAVPENVPSAVFEPMKVESAGGEASCHE